MAWKTTDPDPGQSLITVSAVDRLTVPMFQVSLPDGWTTAQVLPDANNVKVKGEPTPGSLPDWLKIQVDPDTWSIGFTLKSASEDQPVAESFQLYDAQLNEYTSFTPNGTTQTFVFSLPVTSETSSSVFVKIVLPAGAGAANSDKQGSESFPYILDVTRNRFSPDQGPIDNSPAGPTNNPSPNPDPNPNPGGGGGGHGGEYGTPTTDPILVILPPSPPGTNSPSGPPSPPVGPDPLPSVPAKQDDPLTISLPVAVGPLPVRSSAPLGGVFASPEPVPPVDRHEGARADLAMFDPARHLDDADFNPRQVVPDGEPIPESVGVKIIALRGPGGLPMLATALIADTTNAARADSPGMAQPNAETLAPAPTVAHFEAVSTSSEQVSSSSSRTRAESSGRASRRGRRPSVVLGLTLAFALGVSLVLPDLVAALQYVAPSRPSLRLRWIRRALTHG